MEKSLLGKLVNTHGIKGEVKIHTNVKNAPFYLQPDEVIYIEYRNEMLEFKIVNHRIHKKMNMVRFEGITDINEVEKYKGCQVYYIADDYEEVLEEDEVFVGDLIGCEVKTTDGETLGEVVEVFNMGSSDILRVKGNRDCLIPYINSIIVEEDFDNKVIVIELIEGLIE